MYKSILEKNVTKAFLCLTLLTCCTMPKQEKLVTTIDGKTYVDSTESTIREEPTKVKEVKKTNPEVDGVDLGLSVNWATHNVGASAPHKVGYLIPLGNVVGNKKPAKRHYEEVSGASDIATVKMGKEWRMPTAQEMLELIDKCTWEKKTIKGVKGAKVTGPSGESIFLPAPGECIKLKEYLDLDYDWEPNDVGTIAWYWCGTPLEYRNCLHFRLSKGSMVETSMMIADTETFCNAVRAVKEK